jgi:NADH-quinone oxidoreductase subunit E
MAEHIETGPTGSATSGLMPEVAHFAFDEASEAEIAKIIAKYPPGRQASAVLPLLYVAQGQMRRVTRSAWVPRVAMDVIAARLSMPPIRVYEVATFYLMFNTSPVGTYHLQLCTTTPCWLRGSDEVVAACRKFTGIKGWKETSADGMFTMTEVECVGACVNAPILQVDDDFYEDMDGPLTEQLLAALKCGERPKPGSMTGRQTSAPAGGPTTLQTLHFDPAE